MAQPQPMISYPVEDLQAICASIRAFLDEQWQLHLHELQLSPNSFTNCLTPVSIGALAHPTQELLSQIDDWNQRMKAVYDGWYHLASILEQGANTMQTLDHSVS